MAHHDFLTGLPNRRQFETTLKKELASAQRHDHRLVLLYIDLDKFKAVNDQMGHDVGDLFLKEVASRLKSALRTEDFLARLGGDEFAIIALVSSPEYAQSIAEKLQQQVSGPCKISGYDLMISLSIGISSYPEAGTSYTDLCKNADIALYKAKEMGRNAYKFFDSSLEKDYKRRLDIERDIVQALKKEEFFIVFQPVYQLLTQKLRGLEVLLRWQHPLYGLIPPDEFLPIAEEKGVMVSIGEWVLRTACEQYMELFQTINLECALLINLSVMELKNSKFLEFVTKILKETQIPPHVLEFEVTEATIMSNQVNCEKIFNGLRNLDIKVAIDDFGTGYSSLKWLKLLPISSLKIDRSFIEEIGNMDNNDLIIKSIN